MSSRHFLSIRVVRKLVTCNVVVLREQVRGEPQRGGDSQQRQLRRVQAGEGCTRVRHALQHYHLIVACMSQKHIHSHMNERDVRNLASQQREITFDVRVPLIQCQSLV